jgi:hypothetical protein
MLKITLIIDENSNYSKILPIIIFLVDLTFGVVQAVQNYRRQLLPGAVLQIGLPDLFGHVRFAATNVRTAFKSVERRFWVLAIYLP